MTRGLFLALLLVLALPGAASADIYADCIGSPDPDRRLIACELVMTDRKASEDQRLRAYREHGGLLAEAGRHDDAIADFTVVIERSPVDASAYAQRGLAHLVLGKRKAAIADLSDAVRLEPKSPRYLMERGYAHLAAEDALKAIADFDAALALRPGVALVLNNRGLAYRKAGKLDLAIADYSAAIESNPLYALAYANRGYAREAKGDKAAAISDFRAALMIDPSMQGSIQALGRLGVANAKEEAKAAVAKGHALIEAHCSRCHAIDRLGASPNPLAPAFRNLASRYPLLELREPVSRGIAAPHAEMPRFELSESDVDRIVAYVNSLQRSQ